MLLIYVLEGNPAHRKRADELLARSRKRRDLLFTSCLAAGELAAGTEKISPQKATTILKVLGEIGFSFLPFDKGAVAPFGILRADKKVTSADAIHLACAASAGIDLFLTGDKNLVKLDVPGIQFIADFHAPVF